MRMMEDNEEQQPRPPHNHQNNAAHHNANAAAVAAAIVTSGEEFSSCGASSVASSSSSDDESMEKPHPQKQQQPDNIDFYGAYMDDEDEAWVYKHMRGGMEETVTLKTLPSNNNDKTDDVAAKSKRKHPHPKNDTHDKGKGGSSSSSSTSTHKDHDMKNSCTQQEIPETTPPPPMQPPAQVQPSQTAKLLKPRNSDAILSCPCCFTIVCMDCQQHCKYENQFRAMFVMNIGVSWDVQYKYSKQHKGLVSLQESSSSGDTGINNRIVLEEEEDLHHTKMTTTKETQDEIYYSVFCSHCQTQVAVLNMDDEVYHFSGCLASA